MLAHWGQGSQQLYWGLAHVLLGFPCVPGTKPFIVPPERLLQLEVGFLGTGKVPEQGTGLALPK